MLRKFLLAAIFIGPVVLLSPACASFDQFRDFEHRGDVFRTLVRALIDAQPKAARAGAAS